METKEEMASLIAKEQLNHFQVKKWCKNPLAWWKMHEVWFPYVGFVAQQTLGIVGS
jgi:hypothetical protein